MYGCEVFIFIPSEFDLDLFPSLNGRVNFSFFSSNVSIGKVRGFFPPFFNWYFYIIWFTIGFRRWIGIVRRRGVAIKMAARVVARVTKSSTEFWRGFLVFFFFFEAMTARVGYTF